MPRQPVNAKLRPPAPGSALEAVRDTIERVAELAVSATPEALRQSAALIESAISQFSAWRETLESSPPSPHRAVELERLRRAIGKASALMDKANRYYAGWNARLGAHTNGYRPGGEPAALWRPRRLSLQG